MTDTVPTPLDEQARIDRLIDAEQRARRLFDIVVERGLVVAGKTERELSDEVRDLARDELGMQRHWHKRIVRAGPNSVEPYRSSPPDRVIEPDDILFFDFGPLLDGWEADLGRTYVLGDDPAKHRIADALVTIWDDAKAHFDAHPDITGAELFAYVRRVIEDDGWAHATPHAGHLVGEFPHERINGDEVGCYIAEGNPAPMRRLDAAGRQCHWILEIHLVDPERGFGAFHEQLLDIDVP